MRLTQHFYSSENLLAASNAVTSLVFSEMPSPRMSRKQAPSGPGAGPVVGPTAATATPPPAPPPPAPPSAPAPAPVKARSPSPSRRSPASVPGAVPSWGPRPSPGRSSSPARAAGAGAGLTRSGSQEELNAAFERLASGAVTQPGTPPPGRKAVALTRSRSLDRPPGLQRNAANGKLRASARIFSVLFQ